MNSPDLAMTKFSTKNILSILSALFAIALASTVVALALQTYFGRSPQLALVGLLLAALGAGGFAIWLSDRR
jgi:hypothetical protein